MLQPDQRLDGVEFEPHVLVPALPLRRDPIEQLFLQQPETMKEVDAQNSRQFEGGFAHQEVPVVPRIDVWRPEIGDFEHGVHEPFVTQTDRGRLGVLVPISLFGCKTINKQAADGRNRPLRFRALLAR